MRFCTGTYSTANQRFRFDLFNLFDFAVSVNVRGPGTIGVYLTKNLTTK
jgi:hypothetical protein